MYSRGGLLPKGGRGVGGEGWWCGLWVGWGGVGV